MSFAFDLAAADPGFTAAAEAEAEAEGDADAPAPALEDADADGAAVAVPEADGATAEPAGFPAHGPASVQMYLTACTAPEFPILWTAVSAAVLDEDLPFRVRLAQSELAATPWTPFDASAVLASPASAVSTLCFMNGTKTPDNPRISTPAVGSA